MFCYTNCLDFSQIGSISRFLNKGQHIALSMRLVKSRATLNEGVTDKLVTREQMLTKTLYRALAGTSILPFGRGDSRDHFDTTLTVFQKG